MADSLVDELYQLEVDEDQAGSTDTEPVQTAANEAANEAKRREREALWLRVKKLTKNVTSNPLHHIKQFGRKMAGVVSSEKTYWDHSFRLNWDGWDKLLEKEWKEYSLLRWLEIEECMDAPVEVSQRRGIKKGGLQKISNEIRMHLKLQDSERNPHVVQLYDWAPRLNPTILQDQPINKVELLREAALGDNVYEAFATGEYGCPFAGTWNNGAKAKLLKKMFCDTLDGLAFMHSKGVLHRHITPTAIFAAKEWDSNCLEDGTCRFLLGDLLHAVEKNNPSPGDAVATKFSPPEIAAQGTSSERGDVYSLALSLVYVFARHLTANNLPQIDQLSSGAFSDESMRAVEGNTDIPVGLKLLLHDMMKQDQAARPSAQEALDRALATLSTVPQEITITFKATLPIGIYPKPDSVTVDEVPKQWQAYELNVQPGWRIKKINGEECKGFRDKVFTKAKEGPEDFKATFEKGSEREDFEITKKKAMDAWKPKDGNSTSDLAQRAYPCMMDTGLGYDRTMLG